jgi:hypothetical protein
MKKFKPQSSQRTRRREGRKEYVLFPSVYSVFSVVILLQNFCGYFSSSIIPGERLRNEEYLNHRVHRVHGEKNG